MRFPFGNGGERKNPPGSDGPEKPVDFSASVEDAGEGQVASLPEAAMRHLCELVRRYNQRSYEQVISFGWSAYPRFARLGLDRLESQAPEKVRQHCRHVLEVAVRELEPQYPAAVGDVSPIGLLRRHVLEGDTWDVILTQRQEEGLPRLSERTLKNRQHEAYLIILRWARQSSPAKERQLDLPFHRREQLLRRATLAGAVVMALVLLVWGLVHLARPRDASPPAASSTLERQLRAVDPRNIGVSLILDGPGQEGRPALKELLPALRLPELGSELRRVMLLPGENGAPPDLLLVTRTGGRAESTVFLWDALDRRFRWTLQWQPPREEIFTHSTLDSTVYQQAWRVDYVLYASDGWNLGAKLALGYQQLYSPSFIVLVQRKTGRVLAHYAHPGQFNPPLLADLSGDGTPEMLWPGCDNARNRPDLTVLEPTMNNGAASTCIWNRRGEGAVFRILLPDMPALREHYRVGRLSTWLMNDCWSKKTGILLAKVVGHDPEHEPVYSVQLSRGDEIVPGETLFLSDFEEIIWKNEGLSSSSEFPEMESQIEVFKGPQFDAIMGS